jgi:hydrogenase maturation factor
MKNKPLRISAVIVDLDSLKQYAQMETIFEYVISRKVLLAVISNKRAAAIRETLKRLKPAAANVASADAAIADAAIADSAIGDTAVVVSKEDVQPTGPATTEMALAIEKFDLPFDQILAVSSNPLTLEVGQKIGTLTAYLKSSSDLTSSPPLCDFNISEPAQLKKIIRMGTPLPAGKLPNDLLGELLDDFVFDDPSILINPGIGEDTAAADITSEQVLILKSDPITFATDSIGQYAVLINANDIATAGAKPRWLLATLLFPPGVTAWRIRHVVDELRTFSSQWNITLCGGHTEITDAVSRPVVIGMMAGTVTKSDLIDKANMDTGDRILLTKRAAVEGTAIIAREFGEQLKKMAFTDAEIDQGRKFLSHISIIPEAGIAAKSAGTSAMHDVTEGGVATALEEFSIAGGHRIKVDMDRIPVFPETRKICKLFGINPLGLIGSGSLLICCRQPDYENLMASIHHANIEVTCIGEVLGKGQGIEAYLDQKRVEWPKFEVDEITKLF